MAPPSSHPPDPETVDSIYLVQKAQDGELTAYNKLFERYYNRVGAIVRARLGAKMRQDMESSDILQDAMVEAIRGFENFELRDKPGFIAWFAKIVENRIRTANKHAHALKRDKDREVALDHVMSAMSSGILRLEPAATDPLPVEQLARREQEQILEVALGELDERHRQVILLRHHHDASWERVAEMMESPSADAARMLYARAKIELSKLVKRYTHE